MGQNQLTTTEQHLRQIAYMLLLKGTLTVCPGLLYGKMGIAVFFFHYARYAGTCPVSILNPPKVVLKSVKLFQDDRQMNLL